MEERQTTVAVAGLGALVGFGMTLVAWIDPLELSKAARLVVGYAGLGFSVLAFCGLAVVWWKSRWTREGIKIEGPHTPEAMDLSNPDGRRAYYLDIVPLRSLEPPYQLRLRCDTRPEDAIALFLRDSDDSGALRIAPETEVTSGSLAIRRRAVTVSFFRPTLTPPALVRVVVWAHEDFTVLLAERRV